MSNNRKRQLTYQMREEDVNHEWFIFDAKGKTLGRFASEIAKILRGKHKPGFTPQTDCGDGVIILNADKITVTGNKEAQMTYRRYTGYIGGARVTPFEVMRKRKPDYIIRHAVQGMMPRTKLGRQQLTRLRIFAGESHPHIAQKPIEVNA